MLSSGLLRSESSKVVPPLCRSMYSAASGVICISPRAPALDDQRVAAGGGALAAHLVAGQDRDRRVERSLAADLEEEGNLDHRDLGALRQREEPFRGPCLHQRMDLVLQPGQLLGIGEDDL